MRKWTAMLIDKLRQKWKLCYLIIKKNAYALKTPRVVARPVIYGFECYVCLHHCLCLPQCEASARLLLASSSWCNPINSSSSFRPKTPLIHFLTWWPWPLTYDLDLWTWPRYSSTGHTHQKSCPYVCPFSRESGNTHTDRHTDTQTHRRCQNYYTPSLTRGVKI